ncbi:DNA-binding response regulator, NarL/FixJ family, contains REC and HTH domains [Micromonospora phaseoli]|uniref:DNA-binding response regulator, NarL/FixJ family, contains REC and HTH domains n=1 Tax=Micromonospora phaseoli TaxID=1144548 RepID=A0A1H7AWX9_9ACTN|nr:response regulator transcription factor [Micromonospora phaseoli]PZV96154.1 LuxR family two component transcriptional regulator [Micromonospora phaseoli]GIJ79428.1 DNA-binding response regulator [Micromonospora phaseoli]SEJ69426.1 DNA-binding response regulator, NarL/FixJ family, contains REC and HTH domains [Micromonospora phaseoli]
MKRPGPIRVVLVDDHTLFREGLKEVLGTASDIEIVGAGGSGPEAVELTAEHEPDVLLLDVEMPGAGVTATIRQVLGQRPDTQIIVLTMHDDAELVREVLEAGASAYLLKTILRDELLAAVRSVRSSANILLAVSRGTVEQLDRRPPGSGGPGEALTQREREIMILASDALSNQQIASRLHITEATVKRHLTNAYAKLNAVSRVDAIRKAVARRIIPDGRRLSR